MSKIKIICMFFSVLIFSTSGVFSSTGEYVPETDAASDILIGFFDLRDRETFVQITNIDGAESETVHVQIFDVSNNCNENNFFDTYTPNDTHVYDLRNIITNDGNPSGVVLPDDAYGIVSFYRTPDPANESYELIGNLRIEDNNGYEYRSNLAGQSEETRSSDYSTFNFNTESGIILSDIIVIPYDDLGSEIAEISVDDVLNTFKVFDVDIYDLNEVPFSCRNVLYACINQDSPLIDVILNPENVNFGNGTANVAAFEYGINEAIPHSKGGELLCPGNNISDGFVRLKKIGEPTEQFGEIQVAYVGLNNGNGRGSLDANFLQNFETSFPPLDGN